MTYRPLPEGLRIGESEIEGQGLLSDVIIEAHTNLGLTHYKLKSGAWLGTPLGGFINHSDDPNCFITTDESSCNLLISFLLQLNDLFLFFKS